MHTPNIQGDKRHTRKGFSLKPEKIEETRDKYLSDAGVMMFGFYIVMKREEGVSWKMWDLPCWPSRWIWLGPAAPESKLS